LDADAAATYDENFECDVFNGDIATWLAGSRLAEADLVLGGPPCQGFSTLGHRRPDDPRNSLWRHYVEAIERVAPRVFVLENVPGFAKSDEFAMLVEQTNSRGPLRDYSVIHHVVDASHYGTPQRRKRVIVIGWQSELGPLDFPPPTTALHPPTVRDALQGIGWEVADVDLPHPHGPYSSRELHLTRNLRDLSRQRIAAIPPGGNRFALPDELQAPCWRKHTKGSADVMGRLHWDQPSVTIRTEFYKPEKGRYLHPVADRPITHFEASLLQGFPKNYKWMGSKTSIGRQIGNAVPIPLGAVLATHIATWLDSVLGARTST